MEIKFPLELKTNEDGTIELKDGKPIYVDQDKQEIPLDAPKLWGDLKAANNESMQRRLKLEELEAHLAEFGKKYEGLDPEEARKALETVKNYSDKQMVDAGEVDRIKQGVKEGYEQMLKTQKESYNNALTEKEKAIALKESQIRNLLVRGAFDRSDFLRDKTVMFPGAAYAYFGNHFQIQESNGELKAVGMIDGKPIISKANPGEIASTEEAIEILVHNDPQKDRIIRAAGGGTGAFTPDGGDISKGSDDLGTAMYPTMSKKK
jgi:hypothetical protein